MRLWHVLIICILAGLWVQRDHLLASPLGPWLTKMGVTHSAPKTPKTAVKIGETKSSDYVETISEALPHFTARTLDGMDTWSADQLRGKISLVVFFAGWCAPCKNEMPTLMALKQKFPDIYFVGIIYNDTASSGMQMLRQYGNPFNEVVIDRDALAAHAVQLTGVPNSFVTDSAGNLRYRMNGSMTGESDRFYTRLFNQLLAGQ